MGFETGGKGVWENRVVNNSETSKGITENLSNTRGLQVWDIKTYQGGNETCHRFGKELQVITSS